MTEATAVTETETLRRSRNKRRKMYRKANKAIQNIARSEKLRKYHSDHPEVREKMSRVMLQYWTDPQWRKDMADLHTSKEYRETQSKRMKEVYKKKMELR